MTKFLFSELAHNNRQDGDREKLNKDYGSSKRNSKPIQENKAHVKATEVATVTYRVESSQKLGIYEYDRGAQQKPAKKPS